MRISVRKRVTIAHVSLLPVVDFLFLVVFLIVMCSPVRRSDRYPPDGLILPYARSSVPDDNPDPDRLVMCVDHSGTVFIGRAPRSDRWVLDTLAVEARLSRDMETKVNDCVVFIKADERVEWRHVQKILDWCRQDDIAIHRITFGARSFEEGW